MFLQKRGGGGGWEAGLVCFRGLPAEGIES